MINKYKLVQQVVKNPSGSGSIKVKSKHKSAQFSNTFKFQRKLRFNHPANIKRCEMPNGYMYMPTLMLHVLKTI